MLDIKELRLLIDNYLDNKIPFMVNAKGAGRLVIFHKEYVLKFPIALNDSACGYLQNENELNISDALKDETNLGFLDDATEIINPVLFSHRGINVYKRIECDIKKLIAIANVKDKWELDEFIINNYFSKLQCLFDYQNLDLEDLEFSKNWGYDYDSKSFKVIDYGISVQDVY